MKRAARSKVRALPGIRRFAASVLVTCCVVAPSAAHAAGRVFSDDFESGNVSKWSADGTRSMCTVVQRGVDGGAPHGASGMLQCNWNGVVAWNDPNAYSTVTLPQSAWNYNSEFLIRMWLRYDGDVSHTYGGKVVRLFPDDKLDSFYIISQMTDSGGPAQVVWEALSGVQGPTLWAGGPLGDQHWHKVEIYMKASPILSGTAKVWIDGRLVQALTNAVTVAAGHMWGPLYLMSNWSNNPGWEHGANNHVYWDDIEIYTDTGTGASGNMSDATITAGPVPDPPHAVTVQ